MISNEIRTAVNTALASLPAAMNSPEARVCLYAIGLQESRLTHRFQVVQGRPDAKGPARGRWQFERGGGCKGVVTHAASRYWMSLACKQHGVPFNAASIWKAIENDDVLAAIAARLLLFTDPRKLPAMGDEMGVWKLYIRTWRPGKPHLETWKALYDEALHEVMTEQA